jgi:hypothetical protein
MGDAVATVVVIVLIASAALLLRQRSRIVDDEEQGLPPVLRGAKIAFAEKTFRSQRRRLVARLDRAYRTANGLQLVELKTRARDAVYMADVIELSVQKIAVEDETGEPVSGDAWVVVQNSRTGTRRPHRVRLLGVGEITAMSERYNAVVRGKVAWPNPSLSVSQCAQCAHKGRCWAKFGDRGSASSSSAIGLENRSSLCAVIAERMGLALPRSAPAHDSLPARCRLSARQGGRSTDYDPSPTFVRRNSAPQSRHLQT